MIKLEGLIYGKKIKIELESNPHICIAIQGKLATIFDRTDRQGCPQNCPYILNNGWEGQYHEGRLCDVICKGE